MAGGGGWERLGGESGGGTGEWDCTAPSPVPFPFKAPQPSWPPLPRSREGEGPNQPHPPLQPALSTSPSAPCHNTCCSLVKRMRGRKGGEGEWRGEGRRDGGNKAATTMPQPLFRGAGGGRWVSLAFTSRAINPDEKISPSGAGGPGVRGGEGTESSFTLREGPPESLYTGQGVRARS